MAPSFRFRSSELQPIQLRRESWISLTARAPPRRNVALVAARWGARNAVLRRGLPECVVRAPRTAARGREVEEREAPGDREVAAVQERHQPLLRVNEEEGECHLAREHEGRAAREETDDEERAA